jgi:hypothetical protein
MKTRESDVVQKIEKEPLEDADQDLDELYETKGSGKSKVECVCPGCGKVHLMKIHWTGKGMCRKFCESCRDRKTPIDKEDDL